MCVADHLKPFKKTDKQKYQKLMEICQEYKEYKKGKGKKHKTPRSKLTKLLMLVGLVFAVLCLLYIFKTYCYNKEQGTNSQAKPGRGNTSRRSRRNPQTARNAQSQRKVPDFDL